jgi:hypothetical protein
MAYDFDLQDPEGPFVEADGSRVVEFILGFEDDTDTIIVMSVLLVPTDRKDTLELCFGIRAKVGPEPHISAPDYSKDGSYKYIPRERRTTVLASICESIQRLVETEKPPYITMETFYADLPAEALRKYDMVELQIRFNDYVIEDKFRAPDGINYWLFRKRD